MSDLHAAAVALYDRFTHEDMDRRRFMAELTKIAGSTAAANALLMTVAADPAAAAITSESDDRLVIRRDLSGTDPKRLGGYVAAPKAATGRRIAAVIVIHENRGLNRHIEDVTRRLALAGYFAVAPDFLSGIGGTPADEDAARTAIGQLNLEASVAEAVALIGTLKSLDHNNGKVGAVGFCWGGAFVNRLAVAAGDKLGAGVSYYGPAPDPSEATKVKAPILLHYAGLDDRVNATGRPWAEALRAAGAPATAFFYEGAHHAFNNDTSAERYNQQAAELAWQRSLEFFRQHLA